MKKLFIGIDVSKETFDVSIFDEIRMAAVYLSRYDNNDGGYQTMLRDLQMNTCSNGISSGQWLFCCETTGCYDKPLCMWIAAHGMAIWRESALEIKRRGGIRRGKSDKTDSMAIAEYVYRFQDKFKAFVPQEKTLASLKKLYAYRSSLVKLSNNVKAQISACKVPSEAADSIAEFIIAGHEKQLQLLKQELRQVDKKLLELIESDDEINTNYRHIVSVPGVGPVLAAGMIVYSGNFSIIPTARKMASFSGVAPFRNQSGTSLDSRADVSRLCNRQLKGILTMAALSAMRYNEQLKCYRQRMEQAGKPFGIICNNVKCKLIKIIYALIRTDSDFDADHKFTRLAA